MDYSAGFLLASIWAACFSMLFFGLPGVLSIALLGITKRNSSVLLLAPALGLCTFGPFALFFTWSLGYSLLSVLSAWLIFQFGALLILFRQQQQWYKQFVSVNSAWLIAAIMLWATIPTVNIFPFLYESGLFVNIQIFDHMKISIIDSIVREGLPPLNPYYAPEGERIPLVYYYAWHFDVSMIKLVTGVSSWQAEVAFTWFTSFTTLGFLAAIAIRITGKQLAGFFVLLLAFTGPPAEILPKIIAHDWVQWFGLPDIHPLEVLWVQLSWAPQHVFSALSTIVLLFLLSHALVNKHLRWQHAVLTGLTAAAGFGASAWVGGIALACSAPLILLALRLFAVDYSKMVWPLLLAVLVCICFAIPVLTSITSGPSGAGEIPLTIKPYLSTRLIDADSVLEKIVHIILYWIQFLPLSLGILYILGVLAIITYWPKQAENRIFYYLSYVTIFAYLLLVQFVQSDIVNNDFGWRSVMIPIMLLSIWAAVLLTELPLNVANWTPFAARFSQKYYFIPLIVTGVCLGLVVTFSALYWVSKPYPLGNAPSAEALAAHQDFYRLDKAWQAVQQYTADDDVVQSNPDSYTKVVTLWSAPAPWVLFSNRASAFAEPESVNVFAHSYDKQQKHRQYQATQAIFLANPTAETLRYARDKLKIKALLVDPQDPVWATQALETSGVYHLVEQQPNYKIYLAN